MGKDADELRSEIADTRDRMGDTADAIAYKADVPHRMQDAVNDRVDQVKSAITGSVGQARRTAARAADALPDPREAYNAVRENPLGLLFGMAATGFLLGWLLPVTDFETENVKPMVDDLKDRAVDRVQGTIDAARDAAVDSITNATA